MRILLALASLLLLSGTAVADLRPPSRTLHPVADQANILNDRGSRLELYPTQRLTVTKDVTTGRLKRAVKAAAATAPIGPRNLGVVFNHDMQQTGYITGEISFKPKAGFSTVGLPTADFPGLKHLSKAGIYVVQATTPAQFATVLKALQARSDLAWVEPIVTYGLAAN